MGACCTGRLTKTLWSASFARHCVTRYEGMRDAQGEGKNLKKFLSRGCIICPLFPGYNVYMSRRTQQRTWDGTNKFTTQIVFYGTHQTVKYESILTTLILSLLLTLAMLDLDCVPTGSALLAHVQLHIRVGQWLLHHTIFLRSYAWLPLICSWHASFLVLAIQRVRLMCICSHLLNNFKTCGFQVYRRLMHLPLKTFECMLCWCGLSVIFQHMACCLDGVPPEHWHVWFVRTEAKGSGFKRAENVRGLTVTVNFWDLIILTGGILMISEHERKNGRTLPRDWVELNFGMKFDCFQG